VENNVLYDAVMGTAEEF